MTKSNDTKSIPREDISENYYVKEQLAYVSNPATRTGWKRRYDFALQHVRASDCVLDCGCGLGQGTYLLSQRCQKVIGLDIDTRFIEYCRQLSPSCEFTCLDMAHGLPYPDDHFDVIVAIEVLEHLPSGSDIKRSLMHIQRVLKPGGFFVASVPNRQASSRNLSRILKLALLKAGGKFFKKQARWHERFSSWTPNLFRSTLQPYFETVSVFGQQSQGITQEADRAPYLLVRARNYA